MAMRAIEAKIFSGYGGLRKTELTKPQPAKDRVLIRASRLPALRRSITRSCPVDTLEPRRRAYSAMRASVSSRTRVTRGSRREAA